MCEELRHHDVCDGLRCFGLFGTVATESKRKSGASETLPEETDCCCMKQTNRSPLVFDSIPYLTDCRYNQFEPHGFRARGV